MGPEASSNPNPSSMHPYASDYYVTIQSSRMDDERDCSYNSNSFITQCKTSILKTAYAGVWSVYSPSCVGPLPRTGHFFYHDENRHRVYFGYGITPSSKCLNDVWYLDETADFTMNEAVKAEAVQKTEEKISAKEVVVPENNDSPSVSDYIIAGAAIVGVAAVGYHLWKRFFRNDQ